MTPPARILTPARKRRRSTDAPRPPDARPPNRKIALLGGTFDPPHAGHVRISVAALRALTLDGVWWLVSLKNPLKSRIPQDFDARVAQCRRTVRHPAIRICDEERQSRSPYTIDNVRRLKRRHPDIRFVWLMGSDGLSDLHRWKRWRDMANELPIAVHPRPGSILRVASGPAATSLASQRVPVEHAATFATRTPPAWILLPGRPGGESSSDLRRTPPHRRD